MLHLQRVLREFAAKNRNSVNGKHAGFMWHPLATTFHLPLATSFLAIGHVKVKATLRHCHYTRGRLHRLYAVRRLGEGVGVAGV